MTSRSLEDQTLTLQSVASTSPQHLKDDSIELLFNELDDTKSGIVSRQAIEGSLLRVYQDLVPTPKHHHLIHPSRSEDWTVFLDSLFPYDVITFDLKQFHTLVRAWHLPPLSTASTKEPSQRNQTQAPTTEKKISKTLQQLRTTCFTNTYRNIFTLLVICLQLGLALWQFFSFYNNASARAAFGTGVLIAKAATGALYPTLFLMILSMSRWTQHLLRQSSHLRKIVNWEYAQSFHIKMACASFLLGVIHSIAHLSGSYRHAINHPQALSEQLMMRDKTHIPKTYDDLMKWRASWTGLVALGLFTIMSVCGAAPIRKRYFEFFQWSHMLMYPLYAMLLIHGSGAILKSPILGWWLLLPILLIATEMLYRVYRGFLPLEAKVLLVEGNMVALGIKVRNKLSRFRPGQYIYLQIPTISRFQWHPFTVSKISSDSIIIHIRTSAGNWTSSLYQQALKNDEMKVAMEGPYGSPTREFYRYDHTLIFGAGIGITPFSAILFDLFDKLNDSKSPWMRREKEEKREQGHARLKSEDQRRSSIISSDSRLHTSLQKKYISLHWTVRSLQDLQWLSLLLNQISSNLVIKIHVHLYVTQSSKDTSITSIIFRSLLDHHRVSSIQSTSILTGLLQTCHFNRPDLERIMEEYHSASIQSQMVATKSNRKVGVIYCGPVGLSRLLSAKCQQLTSRARKESARISYFYHSESF